MAIEIPTEMSVEAIIRKFIAEELLFIDGNLPIGDDDSLVENSVVDSTGVLELELFVEKVFNIDVRDEEVVPDNFDSVRRLASYVRRKSHRLTHLRQTTAPTQ